MKRILRVPFFRTKTINATIGWFPGVVYDSLWEFSPAGAFRWSGQMLIR